MAWLSTSPRKGSAMDAAASDQEAEHAKATRAFGQRVIGYAAAGLGIRQFLDIGAGLPAPGSTHEIAQKISPACRVVCTDNDPTMLAHSRRALTTVRPGAQPCAWLHGDVRDP